MAQRPIFLAEEPPYPGLAEPPARHTLEPSPATSQMLDIEWNAGFSASQKKKNVVALHEAARKKIPNVLPLEISTKSSERLGWALSAFNLAITLPDGIKTTVECAFQGSKVFKNGGAFTDLYYGTSLDAKRDERLRESGDLKEFNYFGQVWGLTPTTSFYDWLYISALKASPHADEVKRFTGFTDIEFNPKKSFNCQAHAAAMFVAITMRDGDIDLDPATFLRYYMEAEIEHKQFSMI
ncbi:MAG: hypothetical protein HAW65_01130 [Alphaproteobacteria bacterium]|nr:hypothetical protein [Alphaproteobacteria bacterium]